MVDTGIGTLANKNTAAAGRPKVERRRSQILTIRAYPEYKAWLAEAAQAKRTDMVDLIDRALVAYAKQEGLTEPPER